MDNCPLTSSPNNNVEPIIHPEREGWVGMDLDGTLAFYDKWRGEEHIGAPIPSMVKYIKRLLSRGYKVKIFTARVMNGERQITIIQDWLEKQGLPRLEVTNVKDFKMIELYDDRCITVATNTGQFITDYKIVEGGRNTDDLTEESLTEALIEFETRDDIIVKPEDFNKELP